MEKKTIIRIISCLLALSIFGLAPPASGQLDQNEKRDRPHAIFFVSPKQETVLIGAAFEVSFFINTYGQVINAVELDIKFGADKLRVSKPSGGISFVSKWIEPAEVSNSAGKIRLAGEIAEGIKTEAGLGNVLTFEALSLGEAVVEELPTSKIILADGRSENIASGFGKGVYHIVA